MGSVIDVAASVLAQSQRQAEISAQNVANFTTPAYKRRLSFSQLMAAGSVEINPETTPDIQYDLTAGKLINTGKPFDLAISGSGYFVVRSDAGTFYTRHGEFQRAADGRLVTPDGHALQLQDGGDVRVTGETVKVLEDGAVTEDGQPLGRLAVVDIARPAAIRYVDGDLIKAAEADVTEARSPSVRQGMTEASNVSMGNEMVSLMEALRRAEMGQHLVSVYDDLMGRVLTTLGGQQ